MNATPVSEYFSIGTIPPNQYKFLNKIVKVFINQFKYKEDVFTGMTTGHDSLLAEIVVVVVAVVVGTDG